MIIVKMNVGQWTTSISDGANDSQSEIVLFFQHSLHVWATFA